METTIDSLPTPTVSDYEFAQNPASEIDEGKDFFLNLREETTPTTDFRELTKANFVKTVDGEY